MVFGSFRECGRGVNLLEGRYTALDSVVVEITAIMVALLGAGFCSAATVAVDELANRGVDADSDEERAAKTEETLSWWNRRQDAISMVLALGHRLGLIAAVALGMTLVLREIPRSGVGMAGFIVVATLLAVAVTDVVPQVLSKRNAERFAIRALRILRVPYVMAYPVVRGLLGLRQGLSKVVGSDNGDDGEVDESHRVLRRLVHRQDESGEDRQRLLRSVVEFPATTVREVMVPRTDMVTISKEMELDEILLILLDCGHSRIPVHGETLDDIAGLFYAKDLIKLMASGREFDIEDFLRDPYFVPETKSISELLTEFQRQRIHLAVVVDEFGGTEGLITLEDIIEEFFGDIQDEYDVEQSQLVTLSASTVLADARIGIDEIEEHFDVELPQEGEYDSLGGFLLDQTGGVPEAGDEIECDELLFRVLEADERRVDTIEIINGDKSGGQAA